MTEKWASSLFAELGDHDKGLALLEPLYPGRGRLSPREAVRIRRRLGVHYHRSGRVEEARKVFEETLRLADPARDLEDLVFIDSELAELYTLRGRLDEAGEACRRGLDRLQSLDCGDDFRERMTAILRASRGHLELRRMNLALARVEFRAALGISRRFPMAAIRAVILNNLGIVENQLNRFLEARRSFRRAEKLLLLAGERRALISISCNLAVIAAKLGDGDEALWQLERARWLLRRFPGERLEFFVSYTRATVAGLFGDAAEVLEHLPAALKLSRRIGDLHLARFGEVLLAEARMACGRHHQAWKGLRSLLAESGRGAEEAPAILRRQVHARLLLLAAILGRRRATRESREALEAIPRRSWGSWRPGTTWPSASRASSPASR